MTSIQQSHYLDKYEYAIAGAGLSGLSLACALRDQGLSDPLILIDDRQEYHRDHIWCCWNDVRINLDLPFNKVWRKWKIQFKNRTTICETKKYPYSCIFSERYYDHAIAKLEKQAAPTHFLKEQLVAIKSDSKPVVFETDKRSLETKFLFDSRPLPMRKEGLKQYFFGLHVSVNANVFDADCVTLMDFTSLNESRTGFHFFYCLPFSGTNALVESVFVGQEGLSVEEHRQLITKYLDKQFGITKFEVTHTEIGCIPMYTLDPPTPWGDVYPIGTRGGLVRPSTGYGFAAIHEFSQKLAANMQKFHSNVSRGSITLPPILSKRAKLLDSVLLKYLCHKPYDGPLLLSSLFQNVDCEILVRFLCDHSSLEDDAAIFSAMPRKFELGLIMAQQIL